MMELPQEHVEQWKQTMKDYKETKSKLPWGTNPPVEYVNEKMKKEMDAKYDPILQRYTDWNKEDDSRTKEQQVMTHTLAKNKVIYMLQLMGNEFSN